MGGVHPPVLGLSATERIKACGYECCGLSPFIHIRTPEIGLTLDRILLLKTSSLFKAEFKSHLFPEGKKKNPLTHLC